MEHRRFKLAFALMMSIWLIALAPAHRTIEVFTSEHGGAHAVAQRPDAGHGQSPTAPPHQHDESHCSICLFAASLTHASPAPAQVTSLDRVGVFVAPVQTQAFVRIILSIPSDCGPPTFA